MQCFNQIRCKFSRLSLLQQVEFVNYHNGSDALGNFLAFTSDDIGRHMLEFGRRVPLIAYGKSRLELVKRPRPEGREIVGWIYLNTCGKERLPYCVAIHPKRIG